MARSCVFCGRPADSQEHVWPNWAAPLLADQGPLPHFQQVVQDDRPDIERNYPKAAYSVTVGAVCERCNNGLMSELESAAKPYLETMLNGRGRVLHRGGQRTLAAWALKTAMMVEHMHGARRHVIPAEEYEHLYDHGEPSDRIRIWMASYAGTQAVAMGRMYGLDADMASGPNPDRGKPRYLGRGDYFRPSRVSGVRDHGPTVEGLEVNAMNTHVLWPYRGSFTRVPRPGFNDYELVLFADGLLNEFTRLKGSTAA